MGSTTEDNKEANDTAPELSSRPFTAVVTGRPVTAKNTAQNVTQVDVLPKTSNETDTNIVNIKKIAPKESVELNNKTDFRTKTWKPLLGGPTVSERVASHAPCETGYEFANSDSRVTGYRVANSDWQMRRKDHGHTYKETIKRAQSAIKFSRSIESQSR